MVWTASEFYEKSTDEIRKHQEIGETYFHEAGNGLKSQSIVIASDLIGITNSYKAIAMPCSSLRKKRKQDAITIGIEYLADFKGRIMPTSPPELLPRGFLLYGPMDSNTYTDAYASVVFGLNEDRILEVHLTGIEGKLVIPSLEEVNGLNLEDGLKQTLGSIYESRKDSIDLFNKI